MSELFDSIGKKAEQVAPTAAPNGVNGAQAEGQDEQKVVDEIESLCMNCHENASTPP